MKTVIGQFATLEALQTAEQDLRAQHVGEPRMGSIPRPKYAFGPSNVHWLSWDAGAQLGSIVCAGLGALIGLLAGAGVFGGIAHRAVSSHTLLAGLFVGISLGLLFGVLVGGIGMAFNFDDEAPAKPVEKQQELHVLTVQTPDERAPQAEAILRHAHALSVRR